MPQCLYFWIRNIISVRELCSCHIMRELRLQPEWSKQHLKSSPRQICENLFSNKQCCDIRFVEIFKRSSSLSDARSNSKKFGAGLIVVNFDRREDPWLNEASCFTLPSRVTTHKLEPAISNIHVFFYHFCLLLSAKLSRRVSGLHPLSYAWWGGQMVKMSLRPHCPNTMNCWSQRQQTQMKTFF